MRSKLSLAFPITLIPLIGLAIAASSGGQAGAGQKSFEKSNTKFFGQYCVGCHNAKAKAGGLDLEAVERPQSASRSRGTWESILRKLRAGEMPPKGSPQPTPTQLATTEHGIEAEFERLDREDASNPGRVTARRLNRAEYNNTIRDLLAVAYSPADDFPQDDSGYGFDNIGDVLSLSSTQMEMYINAAEKIARTAIFGAEPLKPTLETIEVRGRQIVTSTSIPAAYDVSGLSMPNSLEATHRFPADGEYLFRLKLDGVRPLGSEALHLAVWIDDKQVQALEFDPTGQAAFNTDRQDFSARTIDCRVPVTAGEHRVAAVIVRLYEGLPPEYAGPNPSGRHIQPPEFKPPKNLPPERVEQFRKQFEARLKEKSPTNDVRVSAVEIGGPYNQPKGPSNESLRCVFTCGHLHGGHQPGCARKIIADLGGRAFRHPLTTHDIDRFTHLVTLAQSRGGTFDEGICLAVQAMLVSPHFLFRIEQDPIAVGSPAEHLISQYELASRLSYFLWSSMPDGALRACAAKQTLRQPTVLAAQIKRMLQDPRSGSLAENFGGQWLQFRALESVKPDKARFPQFNDYLRWSMQNETVMFLDNIVRNDRPILDLIDGKYSFINQRLAEFYGIPGVEGTDFRRVNLTGTARGGVLTQGSVLTVTSYPNRTSPVLRGKWILENILNAPPPAPPPGVPNLDVSTVGTDASLRQQLEQHRKNPTCAACHARMDPLGFGLENFNAVGAWRTKDGKIAIDATGSLPDGRNFSGPQGLKSILMADRSAFAACVTSKLLTYALGRGLERYDSSTVNGIAKDIAQHGYRFSSLVQDIVTSRPFQMRRSDIAASQRTVKR